MVRIRAPELSQALPWLNCDRPLSLKSLRGQIVLLDFWTYGCINCLHVIPDLQYLEQKYSNRLTIISIHTAKFDGEQNLESIKQAIFRYGISHPVVVDRDAVRDRVSNVGGTRLSRPLHILGPLRHWRLSHICSN